MHFFELREENQLITISCNRTCGSCYRDFWTVLIKGNILYTVSDATQDVLGNELPELQMQSYDAPDPDSCTDGQMVSSKLNIKLLSADVRSTSQDILVSCSVGYGIHGIVHTQVSAVVSLPDSTRMSFTAATSGKKNCILSF